MKFRFGHDRIQQAAASLMAPEEIPKIHLRIAEELLRRYKDKPKQFEEALLTLVNHLNQGYDEEREEE